MRLLQNPERPADDPGVFDPPNMEYTHGDAKEIV